MSTRMQVVIDAAELMEIKQIANAQHLSLSEWVRQTLRAAMRNAPRKRIQDKLNALNKAVENSRKESGQEVDIDQMLDEIHSSRSQDNLEQ